ncbi:MAG TPA: DUF2946 family protein [Rhizomicrobium sp.]|nr:DUF2946 family protein [Rhizomicrobium sp.]
MASYLIDCMLVISAKRTQTFAKLWQLIVLLVTLAFSVQSQLAQTHIHQTAPLASVNLSHHAGPGQSPLDNSPLDCPFCQVVNHAGAFLVGNTSPSLTTLQLVEIAFPSLFFANASSAIGHSWHSRAPPAP